jgi:hypothetical protein
MRRVHRYRPGLQRRRALRRRERDLPIEVRLVRVARYFEEHGPRLMTEIGRAMALLAIQVRQMCDHLIAVDLPAMRAQLEAAAKREA